MTNAPKDFGALLREWPQIQEDIAFLRAFRRLRVVNSFGYDIPLRTTPTSDNVVLDLRNLTPAGVTPAAPGPSTPAGPTDLPGIYTEMRRAFIQSIGSGAVVAIQFDTTILNSFGVWSATTPSRFTVPTAGVWLFTGDILYAANATGIRQGRLVKNGGSSFTGDARQTVSEVGGQTDSLIAGMVRLEAGDYVELSAYQSSGAALNVLSASLMAVRLCASNAASASTLSTEVQAWMTLVAANLGTLASDSVAIAEAFISAIKFTSIFPKIRYLLPMLGSNVAAARCPLIDPGAAGVSTNLNFVDADFSQATGLKGNGTSKLLITPVKPSQLGSSSNGGLGYWENQIDLTGTSVEVVGCYGNGGNSRFVLDLRSNVRSFRWGNAGNSAGDTTAATNGHYYGQRSSATSRQLWKDTVSIGTNTTNDTAAGAADSNIRALGCDENGSVVYWKGRCALAYLTDGTMTATEITQFHALLQQYLITASGK